MRIARVFATKTKMCPNDMDSFFAEPDLFTSVYDEVHISVTFTWAIKRGYELLEAWRSKAPIIKIGGCAFDDFGNDFNPGIYIKNGCIFTSRGCPNNCSWCFVPKREGKIRELLIQEGNIIMDNNLLACSKQHIEKVIAMLKKQKQISFNQGLDSRLLKDCFVEEIRGLSIKDIWLSMDYDGAEIPLKKAVNKLKRYFKRDKIRCYVLIGYNGDTLEKAKSRLREAWEIGTLPFAMRYRTPSLDLCESYLFKEREWNLLQRQWVRPAIIKSIMRSDK